MHVLQRPDWSGEPVRLSIMWTLTKEGRAIRALLTPIRLGTAAVLRADARAITGVPLRGGSVRHAGRVERRDADEGLAVNEALGYGAPCVALRHHAPPGAAG